MSASHSASHRGLSREEADRALTRLESEHDAIESALLALQDHPGRRLLEGATLGGESQQRWSSAQQGIALLWSLFQSYSETLHTARTLRERGGRRPGGAVLGEITELLQGRSVTVPGGRPSADTGRGGITNAASLTEQLSLPELVERMNAWYGRVIEVVTAADAVWSALPARIDLLVTEVRRVREQAGTVGVQVGEHPAGDALQRLDADLAELRARVHTDPLCFHLPDTPSSTQPDNQAARLPTPTGRVDSSSFDRAARELEEARHEVESLLRLRDEAEERLGALAELLSRADAELAEARQVRGEVLAKIAASEVPAVPGPPAALYDRLTSAGRHRQAARWDLLAPLLDGLEREAAEELRRARGALDAVRAPLAHRDELRGRLDAYHAKVGVHGRVEEPELAHAYQVARRMLWSAPCDLRASEEAVRRYQQLISGLLTSGRVPPAQRAGTEPSGRAGGTGAHGVGTRETGDEAQS